MLSCEPICNSVAGLIYLYFGHLLFDVRRNLHFKLGNSLTALRRKVAHILLGQHIHSFVLGVRYFIFQPLPALIGKVFSDSVRQLAQNPLSLCGLLNIHIRGQPMVEHVAHFGSKLYGVITAHMLFIDSFQPLAETVEQTAQVTARSFPLHDVRLERFCHSLVRRSAPFKVSGIPLFPGHAHIVKQALAVALHTCICFRQGAVFHKRIKKVMPGLVDNGACVRVLK